MTSAATPREGLGPTLKNEPGWYVGDLHAHTLHSAGRVYVRTRGPEGPGLDMTASVGGQTAAMGDLVRIDGTGTLKLMLATERAAGQTLEVVRNGEVAGRLTIPASPSTLSYSLPVAAGQWVHVRLRDAETLTAFSNPIYVRSIR